MISTAARAKLALPILLLSMAGMGGRPAFAADDGGEAMKANIIATCGLQRPDNTFSVVINRNGRPILTLQDAIAGRAAALGDPAHVEDPVPPLIRQAQRQLVVIGRDHADTPQLIRRDQQVGDCARLYLSFLQSIDAPSMQGAQAKLDQNLRDAAATAQRDSAARIEEQRQLRDAAQKIQDEKNAEAAIKQQEGATIAAQAQADAQQRAQAQPATPVQQPATPVQSTGSAPILGMQNGPMQDAAGSPAVHQ